MMCALKAHIGIWRCVPKRPSLLKRPCRFSRGHAEASQRQYRGVNTDLGIGATSCVAARQDT